MSLGDVYESNLGTLMTLSNTILPVGFPESFFTEIFTSEKGLFFTKLAYQNDVAVGTVKAKLLPNKKGGIFHSGVYIEFIVVLGYYRSKGIGKMLLDYIESESKRHFQHDIYLHVATDNVIGMEWYKKNGFKQQGDTLINYYKRTTGSPNAYIMKKTI